MVRIQSAFARLLPASARLLPASARLLPACARLLLVWLGLLGGSATTHAGPREELLRLTPPDCNLVVVVQQLRDHWQALANSKWIAQVAQSPLGKSILDSPEMDQLAKLQEQFLKGLRLTPAQLRDELFGDALVLAFRAGPANQPQMDEGLILTWARDPDLATATLDRLNRLQRLSGELRDTHPVEYSQRTYTRRLRKDGGEEFVYQHGSVVVLASTEAAIRDLIDRQQQAPALAESLPPLEIHLRKLGVQTRAALLWFNPRRFDSELKQTVAQAHGAEAAFLQQFSRYWQACDGLALSLDRSEQFDLALSVSVRTADLPASARRWLASASGSSSLWPAVPREALLAFCGRCDLAALAEMVGEFLTPADRDNARQNLRQWFSGAIDPEQQDALLAWLGPDFGLWLAPPPGQGVGWPRGLFAMRLRHTPTGESLEAPLMETLNYFATLGVAAYNANRPDQIRLRWLKQDNQSLRTIVGEKGLFAVYQPTFGTKDGYWVLGTTPQEVRAFIAPPTNAAPPAPPADATPDRPVLLARVSLKHLASYLKHNQPMFAPLVADPQPEQGNAAGRTRLESIIATLELFDSIELLHRCGSNRAELILRVRPALPLQ